MDAADRPPVYEGLGDTLMRQFNTGLLFSADARAMFYRIVLVNLEADQSLEQAMEGMLEGQGSNDNVRKVATACIESINAGGTLGTGLANSGMVPLAECHLMHAAEIQGTEQMRRIIDEIVSPANRERPNLLKSVLLPQITWLALLLLLMVALYNGQGLVDSLLRIKPDAVDADLPRMVAAVQQWGGYMLTCVLLLLGGIAWLRRNGHGAQRWILRGLFLDHDYRRNVAMEFCYLADVMLSNHATEMDVLDLASVSLSGGYAVHTIRAITTKLEQERPPLQEALRNTIFTDSMADTFTRFVPGNSIEYYPVAFRMCGKLLQNQNASYYVRALSITRIIVGPDPGGHHQYRHAEPV